MLQHGVASVLVFLSICSAEPLDSCTVGSHAQLLFTGNFTQMPGSRVASSAGALEPLYNFARLFLEAVQPHSFPLELAINVTRNLPLDRSKLVQYEAGFVVCLILAILYVLIMPVVGAVLAWRHCHPKEALPDQIVKPSTWPYKDICIATCLAAVVALLLVGVILAFTTNNKVRENMRPNLRQLSSDIGKADEVLKVIPKNIQAVIEEFSVPKREIIKELNGTGNVIGENIISAFTGSVQESFSALTVIIEDVNGAKTNLAQMETRRKSLQARHNNLESGLQAVQSHIQTIQSGCPDCTVPDARRLRTVADYSQIPSVQPQLDQINELSGKLTPGIIQKANASFYSTPEACTQRLEPTMKEIVLDLEKTEDYLRNCSRRIPTLRSLANALSTVRRYVHRYSKVVDDADYIRWSVSVLFCTLILIIVILMAIALCLGLPAEYSSNPYCLLRQDRFKHTAVNLLRSAVVITFIFSWLFIILVFVTLFFGGNAHCLGCRSWTSGKLFEFADSSEDLFVIGPGINSTHEVNSTETPNPTPSFNTSQGGNSSVTVQVNTAEMYRGCLRGQSLFYSMNMDKVFPMDTFLNVSQYLHIFNLRFQALNVKLDHVSLLQNDERENLQEFKDSSFGQMNFTALLNLLNLPVVGTDLMAFAEELDEAAAMDENSAVKEDLENGAKMTRDLVPLVELQESDRIALIIIVNTLNKISQQYEGNVDLALSRIAKTEKEMNLHTPYITGNVSQCLLEKGERYFQEYSGWVRNAVIHEILDCKWLPVTVENIVNAACHNIIDPWNAFWLCLGWCCAFLVPGVILSIKTCRRWWHSVSKSLSTATLEDFDTDSIPEVTKPQKSLKDIDDSSSEHDSDEGNNDEDT
ncbi:prominin-2-like [Engraulis encrasicolus]|uniref:prominin-2-like n=1 Tax=Engraulis encrasicolus TaxID=184585 RepID=UPI002FD424AB